MSSLPCAARSTSRAWPAGASAAVVLRVTSCWKIAPSPAMPVAMPTWRKVLLMPEAMPLRAWCTTPMAVEASGGLTRPMPAPASTKPGISTVQVELASTAVIVSRPTPTRIRPAAEQQPHGHAHASGAPTIGATKNDSSVIGRKRRPACSGL